MLRPRVGVPRDNVERALIEVHSNLTKIMSPNPVDRRQEYIRWALESARALGYLLHAKDVDRLVLSQRSWLIQAGLADGPTSIHLMISTEVEERTRELKDTLEAWQRETATWDRYQTSVLAIPDTNVFMEHKQPFDEVDWASLLKVGAERVLLIVPLIIVDELDRNKRSDERWRAAYSTSKLSYLLGDVAPVDGGSVPIHQDSFPHGEVRLRVLFEPSRHERMPNSDDEIVDQAVTVGLYSGRTPLLVTFDAGMALRARRASLRVRHLGEEHRRPKEEKRKGGRARASTAEASRGRTGVKESRRSPGSGDSLP
jgi:hypothetical protein